MRAGGCWLGHYGALPMKLFRRKTAKTTPASPANWSSLLEELRPAIDSAPEPWSSMLRLSMEQLCDADPLYAPTDFWQPGVRKLLGDLETRGLDSFKSWPSSHFFFYQLYAPVFTNAMVAEVMPLLRETNPRAPERWYNGHLVGASEANRDMDIALGQQHRDCLPIDIEAHGESSIGKPPQHYRPFTKDGSAYGRPYLNYLKLLTGVSRYVDFPVRSVLEICGGFGVMGEILMSSMPEVQYVDIDIPPLGTVAHYYLANRFPERTLLSGLDTAKGTPVHLEPGGPSACLPAWELPKLTGQADLFVNAFSFQEMEPHVVSNYAKQIARLDTKLVVSLNTRAGKPMKADNAIGVQEQVTSNSIVSTFEALGYETVARIGRPAAPPQAELVVLRRR